MASVSFAENRIPAASLLNLSRFFPGCTVVCGFALCTWGVAAAEPPLDLACPASFPTQAPTTERRAEVARLANLHEACQDRADYFAYQGVLLLTLGQPQEAALALEKALLLDPDLAGAQLDYAQALAQLGELDSARSLAGAVAKRPDIPLGLQAWLADNLDTWTGDTWRVDWSIDVLGGGESNLNSAPGISFLTLTLPGGNVPLELAASDQRRSGGALRTVWLGAAARPLGQGLIVFSGELVTRNSPSESDTNQRIVSANAAYVHPALGGQIGVRVDATRLWVGSEPTYSSQGWTLLYQLPSQLSPPACTPSLGYGVEDREFPGASYQAGRYAGPQAWLSCRHAVWDFSLGLLHGEDRARDSTRLGGDQRRSDLAIAIARKVGVATVSVLAQRGRAVDDFAYSPLLGNKARRIDRLAGRLFYEHPLADRWSIIGYLENTSQKSNIDLFKVNNHAIYFGVRLRGP